MPLGASLTGNRCSFNVWAPNHPSVSLVLTSENQTLPMEKAEEGYWQLTVDDVKPGKEYMYKHDQQNVKPDPASHFQPHGIFEPSAVVDHASFPWNDNQWQGIPLKEMVIYELHVGTFTPEGTFAAVTKRAQELSQIGINAVELMPVAQFTGNRNWGYDAVFPYAVQNTYGGPEALKKLVDEFHRNGIAVILDVIYNHLGPEGNVLNAYGPYFLASRHTPWGPALNFDGPASAHVRRFFLENATHWFQNYHVDGLRLDAVYAIIDSSPKHFLEELSEAVENLRSPRKLLLFAENDRVDPKMLMPRTQGGLGIDAVWHDSVHHALHAIFTGERNWYYASYGSMKRLLDALQASHPPQERVPKKKPSTLHQIEPSKLVVFSQNHDQIGNRPQGERLLTLAGLEAAKLAAAIVILSEETPLLFMGEEYGEDAPFLFFTDYTDKALLNAVRTGRKKEFKQNGWKAAGFDPQEQATFLRSKITWEKRFGDKGKAILSYYQNLLRLRKTLCSQANPVMESFFSEGEFLLLIQRQLLNSTVLFVVNFSRKDYPYKFPLVGESFVKVLDSADSAWAGPGSTLPVQAKQGDILSIRPLSIAVYVNSEKVENFE